MKEYVNKYAYGLGTTCSVILIIILTNIFPSFSEVLFTFAEFIFLSYILIKSFKLFTWFMERIELWQLKKSKSSSKVKSTLFYWSGKADIEYHFFYDMLNIEKKEDTFDNLKEIKKKILVRIGSKIGDYYLLKKYLEVYEKNNILEKVNVLFVSVLVSAITTLIGKSIIFEKIIPYFIDVKHNQTEYIKLVINIGFYALFISSILIFVVNEFTRERRRAELFRAIIDSIIMEKERKD